MLARHTSACVTHPPACSCVVQTLTQMLIQLWVSSSHWRSLLSTALFTFRSSPAFFDALEPLRGHVTSLILARDPDSESEGHTLREDDARSLITALPDLRSLSIGCGRDIKGPVALCLACKLTQLRTLSLSVPCYPHVDLVTAAGIVQAQAQASARAGPLKLVLEGD